MASQPFFSPRAMSQAAADTRTLLYRYPDISDRELAALIREFKNLPLLDFGLLSADAKSGTKMDEFYADHGDDLIPALSMTEWAVTTSVIIGVFFLIYLGLG
ncbi:MAG TPA: hypothetical protein VFS87_02340 [Qipengyuania sp.]|nr:hypothetical protein [Qipengyuania sp.]